MRLDYTQVLLTMHKYNNYLIPQIPEMLTQFIINYEEHYLHLLDKKFKIDDILKALAKDFDKLKIITEEAILKQLLIFFNIEVQND